MSGTLWIVTAVVLILWLVGLLLRIGQWVNLLLVVAAVILVVQLINERSSGSPGE
jgi:membrane-bound ClpP family serine protease